MADSVSAAFASASAQREEAYRQRYEELRTADLRPPPPPPPLQVSPPAAGPTAAPAAFLQHEEDDAEAVVAALGAAAPKPVPTVNASPPPPRADTRPMGPREALSASAPRQALRTMQRAVYAVLVLLPLSVMLAAMAAAAARQVRCAQRAQTPAFSGESVFLLRNASAADFSSFCRANAARCCGAHVAGVAHRRRRAVTVRRTRHALRNRRAPACNAKQ
jgi:hypothetical protein